LPGQEKTEKATPKKRKDAREKEGNVLQSKEIGTTVSILGMFVVLSFLGVFMLTQLENVMTFFMTNAGESINVNNEFFTGLALRIVMFIVLIVGPILIAAILLGALPSIIQTKGLFTMKPLKPKFSKLNPITGMKRFFSMQSFVNVIKGIIVISAICTVVYFRIMDLIPEFQKLPDIELKAAIAFIASNIFAIVMMIVIIKVFVSAADYVFQWWQYEKKLKMSKQEVKDEYKQIEGDPLIKSKIKQKQREVAQSRMMEEVPGSDVVVRNPTHYAVALKYDAKIGIFSAPKVVAKGMDVIALKIIKLAEENGVHITEDRPLARMLHDTVQVGDEIPHTLYTAVASILSEVDSIREKIEIK
jgi:flagellar biosynthetic protein FlhB